MQDESVQLRPQNESILLEQKAALDALRNTKPVEKKAEPLNTVFSAPPKQKYRSEIPEILEEKMRQEQADREARARMDGFTPKGGDEVPVPASLWTDIHGETMLKSVMGLPSDNAQTEVINDYILKQMRIGKMEDTQENYQKVLGRILARNNLSMNQQKNYLVKKLSLYLYTTGNDKDEIDDLVFSILNIKRGKHNGIRR